MLAFGMCFLCRSRGRRGGIDGRGRGHSRRRLRHRLGGLGLSGSGSGSSILLLLPGGGLGPRRLAPGALVAELASSLALAATAKLLGEVLGGDLREQLLLVTASEDVDLLHRDGVEPCLYDAPDAAESPGGVDDVQPAQALGVVVLAEGADLFQVRVYLGDLGDADALQVGDGAAGLEEGTGLAAAGGEAGVRQLLVLDR